MYNQPLLFGVAKTINWTPDTGFYVPFGKITSS